MARTAVLSLLPAALILSGWARLEAPSRGAEFLVAALLAVAAVLVPFRWLRVVAGVAAGLAVASLAFDLSPLRARPFDDREFFGPLVSRLWNGVADFYEVALPFAPAEHERMHGTLVLAVFAFTLVAALAIRARRPILAIGATLAGAAWPVTLVPDAASTGRAALLLAAALVLLAALRPGAGRGDRQAAAVGLAIVATALVAVSSPSVAKGGFLDWQTWQPYERERPVSVQYVWNSDYDGITFPKTPTTVLKVRAPRRAPYWRATTLDVFLDDNWREGGEEVDPVRVRESHALTNDPYLPPDALDPESWMPQRVTVEALQDTHLAAASVPVAFEAGVAGSYGSGIAYVGRLRRGQDYRAWSYAPQPTPSELAVSKPDYRPELFDRYLTVGGSVGLPAFGTPGRDAAVQQAFAIDGVLAAYEPLYRQARRVVGRPKNPYAAVVALEAWFRTGGSFRYDETPPIDLNRPPLVAFVNGHRRGYCQHFAGAMALMLRYLGIPARVAAGFTTGRFDEDEREWTVADTNAHTWVEVWFEGYGWMPFDPTPGRGRLRGSYTASSLFFDADGAAAAFVGVAAGALGFDLLRSRAGGGGTSPDDRDRPRGLDPSSGSVDPGSGTAAGADERNDLRLLGFLLVAVVGVIAAFWLIKTARRRARYLSDDPRRVAAAVRAELSDFLADQRVSLPPSATPGELGAVVRDSLRVDASRLARALGEARFGPAREAEHSARLARRELRGVLRRVRRRLGARARLRGLLSLRSFGLRSA